MNTCTQLCADVGPAPGQGCRAWAVFIFKPHLSSKAISKLLRLSERELSLWFPVLLF